MKNLILCLTILLSMISCTNESPKQYAPASTKPIAVETDPGLQIFEPAVDILFVVDNSGSMGIHQDLLVQNLPLFTAEFTQNSMLDYHIGVVTTDMSALSQSGRLQGTPKFITKATPDGDIALAENLLVGTFGSGTEKSYAPVIAALTPPLVSSSANKGFYRADAKLAIVFITDAEDQSGITEAAFLAKLMALKNNDINQILAYGVLPASFDPSCPTQEKRPTNIENFLKMVKKQGSNLMSLCSDTYGSELAALGQDIVRNVGSTIYLTRLPDPKSLKVTVGAEDLSNRLWAYDPNINAVILSKEINWSSFPVGAKVKVHFNAAKADTSTR